MAFQGNWSVRVHGARTGRLERLCFSGEPCPAGRVELTVTATVRFEGGEEIETDLAALALEHPRAA